MVTAPISVRFRPDSRPDSESLVVRGDSSVGRYAFFTRARAQPAFTTRAQGSDAGDPRGLTHSNPFDEG